MPTTPSTRPQAFTALRQIAVTLSAAWDLDTTLDLIARKTTEVMHVDSCSIYLLDPGGETLRLQASTGLARRALGRVTLQMGEGMTGAAVQEGTPVYAAIASQDPHFKLLEPTQENIFQSLLAVPLSILGRPIGAMNVQTVTPHDFTSDEIEILSLIGDLVAGALARAQQHDRQQVQLEELQALARLSEAVTAPQYLDDMLDLVTDMAAQTMNAAVCSLFLLDESGSYLELRSAKYRGIAYQKRPPQPADEGVIGWVVQRGQGLYVPNVLKEPRYQNREQARLAGLVSMLCEPLSVRDKTIGVLICYTNVERLFSEEQVALFATLANQTALAIENAQLVTNAAIVREMHHRIKNNLQSVAMLMQMQIADAARLDTRQVLETNINRIRSIAAVHEALSERGYRMVDVRDVLTRITQMTAETMMPPGSAIKVTVRGEELLMNSRAATDLALVVNELVQNALFHAFPHQEQGSVLVSLGSSPEELIILVRDDGIGMPQGTERGLGLEIAETLVTEDLRGSLRVNRMKPGTEFSIRLPRR